MGCTRSIPCNAWKTFGSAGITNEAQGNNGEKSYIPGETIWDPKFSRTNQANEGMDLLHEQDMEIAYEESPPPPTYEGLEQRFTDEVMKLTREKSDAEDAEFARHQERILGINTEYQKLSSLRALQVQATRKEEFLRKDLQERLNQYHEGKRKPCPNMEVPDAYGCECSQHLLMEKQLVVDSTMILSISMMGNKPCVHQVGEVKEERQRFLCPLVVFTITVLYITRPNHNGLENTA